MIVNQQINLILIVILFLIIPDLIIAVINLKFPLIIMSLGDI
jgi:hypothetical protein